MGPGWLKVQNFSFVKNTKNPNCDFTIEIDDITDFAPLKQQKGKELSPPPMKALYLQIHSEVIYGNKREITTIAAIDVPETDSDKTT